MNIQIQSHVDQATTPVSTRRNRRKPDRLNVSDLDGDTIPGLNCYHGTCHINQSEFEMNEPVRNPAETQIH